MLKSNTIEIHAHSRGGCNEFGHPLTNQSQAWHLAERWREGEGGGTLIFDVKVEDARQCRWRRGKGPDCEIMIYVYMVRLRSDLNN